MIAIVCESIMLKGAIAIGHWITAHGTEAMAYKTGAMLMKSIGVNGFVNTLAAVTGLACVSSLVVGTVIWTAEAVKLLGEALKALYEGDYKKAAKKFAKLVKQLHIKVEFLPDAIESFLLKKADFSIEDASEVAKAVKNLESEILKFITNRH
jgi:outer membrane protein assembly factor BamD (BamD/ComL family)